MIGYYAHFKDGSTCILFHSSYFRDKRVFNTYHHTHLEGFEEQLIEQGFPLTIKSEVDTQEWHFNSIEEFSPWYAEHQDGNLDSDF